MFIVVYQVCKVFPLAVFIRRTCVTSAEAASVALYTIPLTGVFEGRPHRRITGRVALMPQVVYRIQHDRLDFSVSDILLIPLL